MSRYVEVLKEKVDDIDSNKTFPQQRGIIGEQLNTFFNVILKINTFQGVIVIQLFDVFFPLSSTCRKSGVKY